MLRDLDFRLLDEAACLDGPEKVVRALLWTLCAVGDSENFSQGVDDAVAKMIQQRCGGVDATVATTPVAGSLRIGTINLVPVAKCIGVGLDSP